MEPCLALSAQTRDHMSTQWDGGHLKAKQKVLTKNQTCWHRASQTPELWEVNVYCLCQLVYDGDVIACCVLPACEVVSVMSDSSWLPWSVSYLAPLSVGFSRQECWSGLPSPPPGNLLDPGIKPKFLTSPALAGGFFTTSTPGKSGVSEIYLLREV